MFVARPTKRSMGELFAGDLRFEILDGERAVGLVSCARKSLSSAITLDRVAFGVTYARGAADEKVYQAAARLISGAPKPPPGRYELRDAGGQVLASADQVPGDAFSVTRGAVRYRFAKGRSRPFDLTREGDTAPLGDVGQRAFWTTSMHVDLPASLDAPFQLFLLAVLLGLTVQRTERLNTNIP